MAFADLTREVVGVVGNVRERGLSNDPPPIMYVPQAQVKDAFTALGNKILPGSLGGPHKRRPAG